MHASASSFVIVLYMSYFFVKIKEQVVFLSNNHNSKSQLIVGRTGENGQFPALVFSWADTLSIADAFLVDSSRYSDDSYPVGHFCHTVIVHYMYICLCEWIYTFDTIIGCVPFFNITVTGFQSFRERFSRSI